MPFNSGLLQVIRSAFSAERLVFIAEASHLERVRDQVGSDLSSTIEWRVVAPTPKESKYLIRFWNDLRTLGGIGGTLNPEAGNDRLVVTCFDSARLFALKLLELSRLRGIHIQVVSHGEMCEGVVARRHRHPWRRFRETRTAVTSLQGSSIQYLVLEHGIQKRVLEALPSLKGKVEVLEHPLPPNEGSFQARELNVPIRFGFLGVANGAKGFPAFLDLAADASARYPGRAEFHLIGRLEDREGLDLRCLAKDPQADRLSRKHYVAEVQRLHFVVMPYEAGCYELTPSGTFLDAVAWEVPIIAARLPLFERTFEAAGDIGYLFSTKEERNRILREVICSPDPDRYRTQVANLRLLHGSRAPEKLAATYREICARQQAQAKVSR